MKKAKEKTQIFCFGLISRMSENKGSLSLQKRMNFRKKKIRNMIFRILIENDDENDDDNGDNFDA